MVGRATVHRQTGNVFIFFFINFLTLFYVHWYVHWYEGVRSPRTGFSDSCELPCGCWELNLGPREEQSVLLSTKPSLQPAFPLFKDSPTLLFFTDFFLSFSRTSDIFQTRSLNLSNPYCLCFLMNSME